MPKEFFSSIICNSGASLSITNNKHLKVKGVAQAVKVHRQGTVLWCVLDEAGMLQTLKVPALYIPDGKVMLLSVNCLGDV